MDSEPSLSTAQPLELDKGNTATPKMNNKLVYLIRHAQALHNLKYKNHSMPDPDLTPKGVTQCEELLESFPAEESAAIDLIVASPLRRAIKTGLLSFAPVVARGVPIVALPEAQETGAGVKPCDTGSSREALAGEFADAKIDLGLLHDGWNAKVDEPAGPDQLKERALFVRRWLRSRSENAICLVTHGGFLHYLTEDWDGFQEKRGTGWAHCEWRTYEFRDNVDGNDENATLVETANSRARRTAET